MYHTLTIKDQQFLQSYDFSPSFPANFTSIAQIDRLAEKFQEHDCYVLPVDAFFLASQSVNIARTKIKKCYVYVTRCVSVS